MNSGVIGIYPGDAWAPGLNNAWYAMQTAEDNIAAANLEPVKIPTAEGVTENGKVNYVNPYNNAMVFISKDCENLDAVLTYLDWCNRQDPITQQEVNEGPVGVYWYNPTQLMECLKALNGTLMLEVVQHSALLLKTDELVCFQMAVREPKAIESKPQKTKKPRKEAA